MKFPSAFLLLSISFFSHSQMSEKELIMQTVDNVFEAMRTNDSTLLKSCFVEDPTTYTVFTNKEGNAQLVRDNFRRFIEAVGTPKDQVWNEPIWNEKVQIDGIMASVWVDYAFFLDDKMLHCGVDAFQLAKLDNQWKIFQLADTRRKEGCEVPDDAKP